MNKFNVFQIFYDEPTKAAIDPGFLSLDNTTNARPDWYEFWVLLQFLLQHDLKDDHWYGFLSPKFKYKTGLTSANVYEFLEAIDSESYDVAIVSPCWDQIAYYRNPFEQGEVVHPGITNLSQSFFNEMGIELDLENLVCDSNTTVFSNFIIAKPSYWNLWKSIALKFFEFVENSGHQDALKMNQDTHYPSQKMLAPMKTFIQERFPSIVLTLSDFKTANLNTSEHAPIFEKLFNPDLYTRGQLQTCDLLKQNFRLTGEKKYLDAYYVVRSTISTKF